MDRFVYLILRYDRNFFFIVRIVGSNKIQVALFFGTSTVLPLLLLVVVVVVVVIKVGPLNNNILAFFYHRYSRQKKIQQCRHNRIIFMAG